MAKYLYIISDRVMPDRFGVKGKNLHALWANNFSVPLTLCLTVEAYNDYVRINQIESKTEEILKHPDMATNQKSARIVDLIVSSNIPEEIYEEVVENVYLKRMDSKWAIRSSSNMEDLPGLSFAGLYESYLNVQGLEQILEMVRRCWASLWNERAILYREKHDLDHRKASMAVVIQEMISPRYSGVVFTRHPTDATSDEMLLEYCEGLGEDLVSGRIKPYTCRIRRSGSSIIQLNGEDEGGLPDEQLVKLSKLAFSIEECFGPPQDIEWAYDRKGFHILQTRPITQSTRLHQIALDKLWTRANIGEVLPGVVTPLTWSVFSAILLGSPLSSSGIALPENMGIRLIKGRAYLRVDSFLNSFCYLPFVTPETLEKVLGLKLADHSGSYRRPKGFLVRLAQGFFLLNVTGVIPYLAIRIKKMLPLNKAKNKGLEELLRWNIRCFRLHILCTAYAIGTFATINFCLNKWLSPSQAGNILPLILIGYEDLQTAAQGRTLAELALHVQEYPALQKLVEEETEWPESGRRFEAVEGGPQFLSMIETFLETNGARTAEEFELALPRWRENRAFLLAVIRKFIEARSSNFRFSDQGNRQRQQEEAVSKVMSVLPAFRGLIFKRLLSAYKNFATLRENMKYRLMEGYSEIRKVFLETGRELTSRSLLADKEDIFFLTPVEIDACLRGESTMDATNHLILNRKENHSRSKEEQVRDFILDSGGGLGEPANRVSSNNMLIGVGCSPGVVEGSARILHDISEANLLKAGEILITPHTDPGWTPLFLTCKAVVTEIGGFLSHGATVAREYGIPAVVNVPGVTQKIHTGDLIRVDGTEGSIAITRSSAKFGTRGP
jgi:rifampicin phosphotransferase